MKTPFHIDIPKRNIACCLNNERFMPGMDYFSLLLEDETNKIKRQDYCVSCWKQVSTTQDLSNSRGYWKSKIEDKKKAAPTSRAERALILLKTLLENPNPPHAEIFVLVLLLAHMRWLALRKEFVEEGVRYGLYEILNQEEFVKIRNVDLSHIETERIQQSLAAQLNSG